jgi:hypothetical protein
MTTQFKPISLCLRLGDATVLPSSAAISRFSRSAFSSFRPLSESLAGTQIVQIPAFTKNDIRQAFRSNVFTNNDIK